jgi:hypothetical protein
MLQCSGVALCKFGHPESGSKQGVIILKARLGNN